MADGEVMERLIVQFEADLSKLEKSLAKAMGMSAAATKKIEGNFTALEKFMGSTNIGKAMDEVFSAGRAKAISSGAEHLGIFGEALGALGPAGLIAGAGVAAFAISAEQAVKALEWAEQLEVVAKKLGVTTTAIQELDYVAAGSGVSQEVMREGLQKVSQAIGAYQSNIKDARVKSIFEALGISKDDARAWKTPVEGLEAIADKIHALKSTTEQLSLAKGLKVPDEMVPLLQMGGDRIREMRGEAEKVGAVMDHSMVEKAGEMAARLKETNLVISTQLKTAFLELAPAVVKIVTLMASMAKFAADTAESFANVSIDGTMDYSGFSKGHLERTASDIQGQMALDVAEIKRRDAGAPGANSWNKDGTARNQGAVGAQYNMLKRELQSIWEAEVVKVKDDAEYSASVGGGGATGLGAEKGGKRDPRDKTEQLTTAADRALDDARKAEAEATKALAVNVQARADAEKAAIAEELKVTLGKLAAQRAALLGDQSIEGPASDILQKRIEEAAIIAQRVAKEKTDLIDREAGDALAKQATAYSNQQLAGQIADLALQADVAGKGEARRDIELKILDLKDQIETASLEEVIAAKGTTDAERALAKLKLEQLNKTKGGRIAAVDGANKNEGPLAAYSSSLSQNLSGGAQAVEVKGLETFNKGLTDAIMNSGKLGDVFKNVLRQMEQELVQLGIERFLTKPLADALSPTSGGGSAGGAAGGPPVGLFATIGHVLGFYASGTDNAPGGPAIVGENGPELINLPRGSQVVPNDIMRGLSNLNPPAMAQQNHYSINVAVDAKDAVLTSQVSDWINAGMRQAIAVSVPMAVGSARRVSANDLAQRSRNTVR